MIDFLKRFYYIGIIIGLLILCMAIYSAGGNSEALKQLLKRRPKEESGDPKLPAKPEMVDYLDMYRQKLKNL